MFGRQCVFFFAPLTIDLLPTIVSISNIVTSCAYARHVLWWLYACDMMFVSFYSVLSLVGVYLSVQTHHDMNNCLSLELDTVGNFYRKKNSMITFQWYRLNCRTLIWKVTTMSPACRHYFFHSIDNRSACHFFFQKKISVSFWTCFRSWFLVFASVVAASVVVIFPRKCMCIVFSNDIFNQSHAVEALISDNNGFYRCVHCTCT